MILSINKWTKKDRSIFLDYLKTFGESEKIPRPASVLNTKYPTLAIKTADIVKITKGIMEGNYTSFLDLGIDDYYESIAIYGLIISRMKDLDTFLHYLYKYLDYMNCWAHCDLMHFPDPFKHYETYFALSRKFRTDQRVMVRRLSLFILFHYRKEEEHLDFILESLLDFQDDNEYYVIMMAGWLLCECIIYHQDRTLNFIENNNINKKIQNKAIQKCRESRRFSQTQKDFLNKFKIK